MICLDAKMLDPDNMPVWIQNVVGKEAFCSDIIAGVNDDDCAIIKNSDLITIVTTDFINANTISEQLGIATYKDLGALVVKNNISDLCGSGAKPEYILLGVCLERGCTEEDFKDVILGAHKEARKYGVKIIGGDSKLGRARSLYGVAIGSAKSADNLFIKNNGCVGDDIWASGVMGGCAAGTIYLEQNKRSGEEGLIKWAKSSVLNPTIPIEKSLALASTSFRKSGADVSDGLAHDISTICDSSGVGAMIDCSLLPIDENLRQVGKELGIVPWLFGFSLGGDMQFLVTANPKESHLFEKLGYVRIGELVEGSGVSLKHDGEVKKIAALGHRDSRGVSFYEEAKLILKEITGKLGE